MFDTSLVLMHISSLHTFIQNFELKTKTFQSSILSNYESLEQNILYIRKNSNRNSI